MPYEAEISRANPAAFFFMVDQSYSMSERQANSQGTKAANLATVVNRLLNDLVIRSSKGEEVFGYFEIGMIGYGNEDYGPTRVGSAFGGPLQGRDVVSIAEVADFPIRVEQRTKKESDGAGGIIEMNIDFPVWLEPVYSHNTPMTEAMSYTFNLVADWVAQHPNSFPPIVLNITDGMPNDGDPQDLARAIRELETSDGNVLMFSLHLSANDAAQQIILPNDVNQLPDEYAELLFRMSSILPDKWYGMAAEMGLNVGTGSRSFIFNADVVAMTRFLEIGTRQPTDIK